jgi:hypothetical protein
VGWRPLRLVVYDATDVRKPGAPIVPRVVRRTDGTAEGTVGLSKFWWLGSWMHIYGMHADGALGASSWGEALRWAASFARSRNAKLAELQCWGHGGFGFMRMGGTRWDREALAGRSPLAADLDGLRDVLADDALVWLRCCSAFGAPPGRAFAPALADRLRARVAGHTFIIGAWQSGTHSLRPTERPSWDEGEGIERRADGSILPRNSTMTAPRTLACLRMSLPRDW